MDLATGPERLLKEGAADRRRPGFIGSALVRELLSRGDEVLAVDKLTYAGVEASLTEVADHPASAS
ncbi:NAD-dependent epimerase/dehydratase family protein [Brevundimonas naejangsanensis]|uniref:NAD-dependent epimerase/dehydratase family protein n=1 Tax=Brevundimonas naejangsanensis TaxID=588932 RepID=UPI001F208014|nr:NAD-dependent epimerase/dehydratase family protein [Brevundimonas naejangsanensis]